MNPEPRQHRQPGGQPIAGAFALCVAVIVGLGAWKWALERRVESLAVERSRLSHEWTNLAADLQEANVMRPKFERTLGRPARIAADRAKPRWTPALHGIATAAGNAIALTEVHARSQAEDPGACEIRVHGVARGAQPRLEAERFREAVEENVKL